MPNKVRTRNIYWSYKLTATLNEVKSLLYVFRLYENLKKKNHDDQSASLSDRYCDCSALLFLVAFVSTKRNALNGLRDMFEGDIDDMTRKHQTPDTRGDHDSFEDLFDAQGDES